MGSTVRYLSILLAVQIGLILFLHTSKQDLGAFSSGERLMPLELSAIDSITINDNEQNRVTLQSKDGKWILPESSGFPVSQDALNDFTKKLFEMTKSWPVGSTLIAAKQLKLGEDDFERKIIFAKGDKAIKTLLLGSSPGFKKIHARVTDDTHSFAIPFSEYEASARAVDWFDKRFLNLARDDLKRIELHSFALVRENDTWKVDGLKDNEESAKEQVDDAIGAVSSLTFLDVLGTENKPEYKQAAPNLAYVVEKKDGKRVTYNFSGGDSEKYAYLKNSDSPYYFKMSNTVGEKIAKITRAALVQEKTSTSPAVNANSQEPATPK